MSTNRKKINIYVCTYLYMCVHGVAQIIFMITINMIDWIWRVVFCFQIYTPDILLEAAALGAIRSKLTN